MPDYEPTDKEYIRRVVQEELIYRTPQLAVVTEVFPHSEEGDDSNYEVGVSLLHGDTGAGNQPSLDRVPVAVSMHGAGHGLQVDDIVVVQYLNGDGTNPVVTHVAYGDEDDERAPLTEEGDYRMRIGENAVMEIVQSGDGGDRMLNVGLQGEDRQGIDFGLSLNLDDGSFTIQDGAEKGITFDGDGNGIIDWESMAKPWGAAGPVDWEDPQPAPIPGRERLAVTQVQGSNGQPVDNADVVVGSGGGDPPDGPVGGPDGNWSPTFYDNFDQGGLNSDNWSIGFGFGREHGSTLETVRDQDVWVDSDNNHLVLQATDDGGWFSGAVNTKGKHYQQQGYWEASVQIPDSSMGTAGVLPAFWAKPNNEDWPPEMDIFEFMDSRETPQYHIHYGAEPNNTDSGASHTPGGDLSQDFYVYGAHWTDTHTDFYFEGEQVARISDGHGTSNRNMNYGQPFYTMLNIHLWDRDWLGGHPSQSSFPQYMRVNWVRMWQ